MPINGVVESKLRFLEQTLADPEIIYGLVKNRLDRFHEFADEIRRACAGQTRGPSDG